MRLLRSEKEKSFSCHLNIVGHPTSGRRAHTTFPAAQLLQYEQACRSSTCQVAPGALESHAVIDVTHAVVADSNRDGATGPSCPTAIHIRRPRAPFLRARPRPVTRAKYELAGGGGKQVAVIGLQLILNTHSTLEQRFDVQ